MEKYSTWWLIPVSSLFHPSFPSEPYLSHWNSQGCNLRVVGRSSSRIAGFSGQMEPLRPCRIAGFSLRWPFGRYSPFSDIPMYSMYSHIYIYVYTHTHVSFLESPGMFQQTREMPGFWRFDPWLAHLEMDNSESALPTSGESSCTWFAASLNCWEDYRTSD